MLSIRRFYPTQFRDLDRLKVFASEVGGEEFSAIVTTTKVLWVVYCSDKLVALAGADLDEKEAHFRLCVVQPAFRNRGLQTRLIHTRLRWAKKAGASHVVTYTNKHNRKSLCNLIKAGFVVHSYSDPFVTVRKEL